MTTRLQAALAPRIAPVVLANITTRCPYHDAHLFQEGDSPFDPFAAHPAFCNSFDWHSSVHSHWTAIQLLEHFCVVDDPPAAICGRLRAAVAANLTPTKLASETSYLADHPTYERPYGWAWALRLAASVDGTNDVSQDSRFPLRHLAKLVAGSAMTWLRQLPAPVRHGVHGNTAFALALLLDASRKLGFSELSSDIESRARTWFGGDRDYPQAWERSGNDFLSPALAEADLMRVVLPNAAFVRWWYGFVPELSTDAALLQVVEVPKVIDGGIAHLHGLNLSRAAMLARIASALLATALGGPALSQISKELLRRAEALYRAGVDEAIEGGYLSTHWLATFAWDAASSIDAAMHIAETRVSHL